MTNDRLNQLLEFIKKDPDDPFLNYALATEYLNQNNPEEARKRFESLMQNHPDYSATYYHLGKLYERMNEKEKAVAVYKKGLDVTRKSHELHTFSELQQAYNEAMGLDYEE